MPQEKDHPFVFQKQERQICSMQWWKKLGLRILQFYFMRYHGFIKVIIKKICLLIYERAHWVIFAETFIFTYIVSLRGISFHNFYKNWDGLSYNTHTRCSFSRLNFLIYNHIIFGGWSCVISMNRWCLCLLVLLSYWFVMLSCPLGLSSCWFVMSSCRIMEWCL